MKQVAKYWKVFLAVLMLLIAIPVFVLLYLPNKQAYESEEQQLSNNIALLQETIAQNQRYAGVQDQIPGEEAALEQSRLELYQHFPKAMKEEDQLLYLSELEKAFSGEAVGELGYNEELHDYFLSHQELGSADITFTFGVTTPLALLNDGSILEGQTMTVYFTGGYENFKNMLRYLATDSRVVSIQNSSITKWIDGEDAVSGSLTLLYYVMDSDSLEYTAPEITVSGTGKSNLFE